MMNSHLLMVQWIVAQLRWLRGNVSGQVPVKLHLLDFPDKVPVGWHCKFVKQSDSEVRARDQPEVVKLEPWSFLLSLTKLFMITHNRK